MDSSFNLKANGVNRIQGSNSHSLDQHSATNQQQAQKQPQPAVIETKTCIKGYDYMSNATYNEYSVLKNLGGGAYGRVVLAQKNHSFELFAIKQPKRKKGNNRNGMSELDIQKEIDVLKIFSKNEHRHIVRLYEVIDDKEDEKLHLIMDYCPNQILSFKEDTLTFRPPNVLLEKNIAVRHNMSFGKNMLKLANGGQSAGSANGQNDLSSRGFLTEDQIRLYSGQLLEALKHIHKNGILHLDIKPANVLIDHNLDIKITDFGSSQPFKDENDLISAAKGTSYFLAPEALLQNNSTYFSGRKCDVWCTGVTIYCMVFNKLPYQLSGRGFSEITQAIRNMNIDFDSLTIEKGQKTDSDGHPIDRHISEGLKNFLQKMLQKDQL